MAKKQRKSLKKRIFLTVLAVIAVAVAATILIIKHSDSSNKEPFATHSTAADNDLNNARKKSSSPAQTLDNGPTLSSGSSSSGNTTSTTSPTLTITRAGVDDNSLEIGTLVNGATSGTCTLSVSQAGQKSITAAGQVVLQNNSYSCPVFNIPTNQFPNQGDWNVSVTLTSGSTSITSDWANNPVNLSNSI
jgi:hypothetical protein